MICNKSVSNLLHYKLIQDLKGLLVISQRYRMILIIAGRDMDKKIGRPHTAENYFVK